MPSSDPPHRARGRRGVPEFDIRKYGAVGDGATPDHPAIQRAIDAAAAAGGGRVLVPGGRKYLIGGLTLRGDIDFHLADDAELLASTVWSHYGPGEPPAGDVNPVAHTLGLLRMDGGSNLRITGTGVLNGRALLFMSERVDEWWVPGRWRPRMFLLTGVAGLEISGVTIVDSPSWTVHLLGCRDVLVDGITIRNQLDVPNCDGVNPDHCRDVEIRKCRISAGDDAIVIKTSRRGEGYGPSANIRASDCVLESQSAALKIGSESVEDIRDVRFERCTIASGCRALCLQLRDEGDIRDVVFEDISFRSRFHSDSWWGMGEGLSFTAFPRSPGAPVGRISGVRVRNVTGTSENSLRVCGCAESRIEDVLLENIAVAIDRWTPYVGGRWDNRPTSAAPGIEPHRTAAFSVRDADRVTLRDCAVAWGGRREAYFGPALEAARVTGLAYPGFSGAAAHPDRDPAIAID